MRPELTFYSLYSKMPAPKKGEAPIAPRKQLDDYVNTAKAVRSREIRLGLSGIQLALVRAEGADRKAKFDALARLRGSADYRAAANNHQKQQMEDAVIEALFQARFDNGQSGNAFLLTAVFGTS
jgi:hypothetical protein